MDFTWIALFVAAALFLGMVIFSEAGRRLKIAQLASNPDDAPRSVTMAEGSVFGLLGLIIAFTFAGAVTRFQDRRGLVTDETNAIGTAICALICCLPMHSRRCGIYFDSIWTCVCQPISRPGRMRLH